jgi:hypothetical protein
MHESAATESGPTASPRQRDVVDTRIALNDATIRRALERLPDLSALEEQLLFRLCCLSLQHGFAWIRQATLAELLRYSERSVRDATKRVCELELLVTVRVRDGLHYFPQWEKLGLDVDAVASDRPAKAAGSDRQKLPVLLGSTKGSDKPNSSRARVRATPDAAALSSSVLQAEEAKAEPSIAKPVAPEPPELGAVHDRFGPEAARDVRDVLRTEVADHPELGLAALQRLLRMQSSEIRTTPGACFRGFVRLAREGRLAPSPSTNSPAELANSHEAEPAAAAALAREALTALRERRREVYEMLERVQLDREKARPLRAELAEINAQLPSRRWTPPPSHVAYEARDGKTGQSMVEAVERLLHAPSRVVAVAAQQLEPEETVALVRQHAVSRPNFAAVLVAQLKPDLAESVVLELATLDRFALLASLQEFDPAAAERLETSLSPISN